MNHRSLLNLFIVFSLFTCFAIVPHINAFAQEKKKDGIYSNHSMKAENKKCAKIIFDEDRELKDDWVDKLIESKIDINCNIYTDVEINYYLYDLEQEPPFRRFPEETIETKVLVTPLYLSLNNLNDPSDQEKLIKAGADINKLLWTQNIIEIMALTSVFDIYNLIKNYKINFNINSIKSVDKKSIMRMLIVKLLQNSYSLFEDGKITSEDTNDEGINYATEFSSYYELLINFLKFGADIKGGKEKLNDLLEMPRDKFANEIVKYGFNINEKDIRGVTPLMEMIYYRSVDNMLPSPSMLEESQNQNKDLTNRKFEHYDPIQVLIDAGADVNLADNEGHTPLHIAMHPKVIRALLNKGANTNARDRRGQTPLHAAVFKDIRVLQSILEACPNSNIKDRQGNTALDLAIAKGFEEQISLLKAYNPKNCSNIVPEKNATTKQKSTKKPTINKSKLVKKG